MKNILILKNSRFKLKSKEIVFTFFSKYILYGFIVVFLSCSLLSCKRKDNSQTGDDGSTPQVEQGQGRDVAVSCKCAKGEEAPVLDSESRRNISSYVIDKAERVFLY